MLNRRRLTLAGGLAAIVAVALAGGWYFLIRDDAPPPVDLASAAASVRDTPTPTVTAAPQPTGASTETPAATPTEKPARADGDLTGVWTLSDRGESFAGYRVQEQLSNIGANTAVGRTSTIEATLEFDGDAIINVEITVDLTQLQSDDSRRDGQLRRRGLETNRFPTANFTLTEPIALDGVPEEGVPIAATAIGDFTLHGVTRSVEMPIEGQLTDGLVVVIGSLEVDFADYGIGNLTGFIVLSVEDRGVMEFQVVFE